MNDLPTVNFLRRVKDTFRVVKDGLHTMIKTVKFCFTIVKFIKIRTVEQCRQ